MRSFLPTLDLVLGSLTLYAKDIAILAFLALAGALSRALLGLQRSKTREAVKKSLCSGGISDGRSPTGSIGVQKSDTTLAMEFQELQR